MTALARDEITRGTAAEYRAFIELLAGLDADQWSIPTRCDGWTVAHVAGHVTGQLDDVVNFRFDELSRPDSPEIQAARHRDHSPSEVAAELERLVETFEVAVGAFDDAAWDAPIDESFGSQTIGEGVHALWDDTYVHADDVRAALGREPERGPGMRAAILRLAQVLTEQEWRPATLVLDGVERVEISGGGDEITGDPHEFVLVATGRADPATFGLDETVNVYR